MTVASWIGLLAGVLALSAAIEAGNDLSVAVPVAAAGVALVAVVAVVEIRERSSRLSTARGAVVVRQVPAGVASDSLLQLRRAFQAGVFGRSSVLATLRALERDMAPTGRTLLSLEEERRILELPPDEFRRWVDDRVRRIEAAT